MNNLEQWKDITAQKASQMSKQDILAMVAGMPREEVLEFVDWLDRAGKNAAEHAEELETYVTSRK